MIMVYIASRSSFAFLRDIHGRMFELRANQIYLLISYGLVKLTIIDSYGKISYCDYRSNIKTHWEILGESSIDACLFCKEFAKRHKTVNILSMSGRIFATNKHSVYFIVYTDNAVIFAFIFPSDRIKFVNNSCHYLELFW